MRDQPKVEAKVEVKEEASVTRLTKNQRKRLRHKNHLYLRQLKEELNQVDNNSHIKTGLQAFMNSGDNQPDIDITNVVATGMRRKLKKKLKRLQSQDLNEQQIFYSLQRAQRKIHKCHDRTIFSGKSQLVERRKKRMDKLKSNRLRQKKQILQRMQ